MAAPESRCGGAAEKSVSGAALVVLVGLGSQTAESDMSVRPTRSVDSSRDEEKSAGMPEAFSAEVSIH